MLCLLGGTFDPVHYGHLRPAAEAMHALGAVELRLIPAGLPPHRAPPQASAADRLAMARLACGEFPGFTVDEREINRAGPSYTVPTLESLRAEVGDRPLVLFLGADAYAGIGRWHRATELPELAHLVILDRPCATRPSGGAPADPPWLHSRVVRDPAILSGRPSGVVLHLDANPQVISATDLRVRAARWEDLAAWTPATVAAYIHGHGLYRGA